MRIRAALELRNREEEAAVKLATVGRDTVNLARVIGRPDVVA
jgi:hypothetical protein